MILICRKGLAGMHMQGKSDPDLQESLAGMHMQGKSDPDLQKSLFRDAFASGK